MNSIKIELKKKKKNQIFAVVKNISKDPAYFGSFSLSHNWEQLNAMCLLVKVFAQIQSIFCQEESYFIGDKDYCKIL